MKRCPNVELGMSLPIAGAWDRCILGKERPFSICCASAGSPIGCWEGFLDVKWSFEFSNPEQINLPTFLGGIKQSMQMDCFTCWRIALLTWVGNFDDPPLKPLMKSNPTSLAGNFRRPSLSRHSHLFDGMIFDGNCCTGNRDQWHYNQWTLSQVRNMIWKKYIPMFSCKRTWKTTEKNRFNVILHTSQFQQQKTTNFSTSFSPLGESSEIFPGPSQRRQQQSSKSWQKPCPLPFLPRQIGRSNRIVCWGVTSSCVWGGTRLWTKKPVKLMGF